MNWRQVTPCYAGPRRVAIVDKLRHEVIQVPLANPAAAAIVSSPRIFEGLEAPPEHGPSPADLAEIEAALAEGIVKTRAVLARALAG